MNKCKNIIANSCNNVALVDVCDVVADLHNAVLEETKVVIPSVINDWDIFNMVSTEDTEKIKKLFANQEFWRNLPLVAGAQEGIEKIRSKGFHVQWVTSPWYSCKDWENIRRAWLHQHFKSEEHDMTATSRKYMVEGAFLIDDRPKHIQQWAALRPSKTAYLFETKFNTFFKWDKRFDWSIVDTLFKI
jgi:5'(3')-deoxyribonucleotidase